MFHITNQNTYYFIINSCITLFLADAQLLRRCPAFADTTYTATGTHFFHQANLTSAQLLLRLNPPTAVCALNHILHLTMEDDEVGPPSLSYSYYCHPRLASVTCQDLTLTQNQGASPRELLLEACRRNNTNLLAELLARFPTPDKIAHLLNTSTDGVGNYCLHVAAAHGACT